MAPGRKRQTRAARHPCARDRRLDAFLKDFDREVRTRLEQVRAAGKSLQKEVGNLYNVELLRLPLALRQMNWIRFHALGDSERALEKVASAEVDIVEITQLASQAIQTPLKTARKAKKVKQAVETIEEEAGTSLLPAGKRSRQENQAATEADPEAPKARKAHTSTKRAPVSNRSRPPSSRSTHFRKRSSKVNFSTPVSRGAPAKGTSPAPTPSAKFDSSVFRTPGLRAPATHERVFSVSLNGSPLADNSEVFLTLPVGGGESIRIRASELSKKDLMCLNAQTLGSVKKLSSQLAHLCSSVRGHQ